ncbi:MAG TPA: hypothetical protein VNE63_11805 [Candidatus Acidoferrales bacterium]|nr:hypothetical protein [Candidatus Acidoferrales bacterium]
MKPKDRTQTEERRLREQERLDALKTAAERNKWGQFATPPALARSLARYALGLMEGRPVRFLDPAIGTGSFYSSLLHESPRGGIESAAGVELDPLFAQCASSLWAESGLRIIEGDFTRKPVPNKRFNLILTNPPYVRHHHLDLGEKVRLKTLLAQSLRLDISGLAGLYCYFLLLSHDWLEDGGLSVWLIPSEFMDVNYGSALRRYLTESVTLLHIHRFAPADVQFTDALVSSAIVVFRKSPPPAGHAARVSLGGSIEEPHQEAAVPLATLAHSRKWTHFPAHMPHDHNGDMTLGDLFTIKRGLATGANNFFILTREETDRWEIPHEFLKPILPSPRYLESDIVSATSRGAPELPQRLFLLDCAEQEAVIHTKWPRFYEYLQKGKEQNVHASYLTSRRVPWYSQEKRLPAPFLCTYMGRSANGKGPFRFVWNRSQATAHNVYLLLYPKNSLHEALRHHPELEGDVFRALQEIKSTEIASEGRVYGGGLHKVEPKELAQITARPIVDGLASHLQMERQGLLF